MLKAKLTLTLWIPDNRKGAAASPSMSHRCGESQVLFVIVIHPSRAKTSTLLTLTRPVLFHTVSEVVRTVWRAVLPL